MGSVGDNTASFTINTGANYEIDVFQPGTNTGALCNITASFVMGSVSYTITAQSSDNVADPGAAPYYFMPPSTSQDESLTPGTWQITASSDTCNFEIQVGAPPGS